MKRLALMVAAAVIAATVTTPALFASAAEDWFGQIRMDLGPKPNYYPQAKPLNIRSDKLPDREDVFIFHYELLGRDDVPRGEMPMWLNCYGDRWSITDPPNMPAGRGSVTLACKPDIVFIRHQERPTELDEGKPRGYLYLRWRITNPGPPPPRQAVTIAAPAPEPITHMVSLREGRWKVHPEITEGSSWRIPGCVEKWAGDQGDRVIRVGIGQCSSPITVEIRTMDEYGFRFLPRGEETT